MSSMIEMGVLTHENRQISFLEKEKRVADSLRRDAPTWKGNALPIAADGIQVARNILSSFNKFGPTCKFVMQSGFIPGVIWVLLGASETKQGLNELNQSRAIRDREGVCRAQTRLFSGALGVTGALLYLANKVTDIAGVAESVATGLDLTSTLFFGAGSIIGMAMAGCGVYRAYSFRAAVDRRLNDPAIQSEAARCLQTLQFLRDSMIVTDKERAAIIASASEENPQISFAELQSIVERRLTERTQAKMKHFKRRTSQKSLGLILRQVESLTAQLEKGEGVASAQKLIGEIKRESGKKGALYLVALIAGAIGFAALIAGTFFSLGALPFILGAISTAIFLAMTLSSHVQNALERGVAPDMAYAHHI